MGIMDENGIDVDFSLSEREGSRSTALRVDPGRHRGPPLPGETPEERKDRRIEELEERLRKLEHEEKKRNWRDLFRIFPFRH